MAHAESMPQELVHRGQMLRLSFREPVPTEASMLWGRRQREGGIGVDQGSLIAWNQSVIPSSISARDCATKVWFKNRAEISQRLCRRSDEYGYYESLRHLNLSPSLFFREIEVSHPMRP